MTAPEGRTEEIRVSWWERSPMACGGDTEKGRQHEQGQARSCRMKSSQTDEDRQAPTLPCWSLTHGHETQGSLLTHLTPITRAPGSTRPQVTMAGRLGTIRRKAILIAARAAAHQPPGGAQTTSGGTLWATEDVHKSSRPSPCRPHLRRPHVGKTDPPPTT